MSWMRRFRRALGGVEHTKEPHRDARSFHWLDDATRDAAYAARLLRHNPLFTLTAAFSLAIGIGGTTTIFTVANALLFRPAAGVTRPDRLVDIDRTNGRFGVNLISYPDYLDIRQRATTLDDVFAYKLELTPMSLGRAGADGSVFAEPVFGGVVTANYFPALGVTPAAGRLFGPTDSEQLDASPIVVLSHSLWVRRFDKSPSIVGQAVSLNGRPFTVVGVAREGFRGTTILAADLWVPIGATPFTDKGYVARTAAWGLVGGRVKPGVSMAQAAAEIGAIGRTLERDYPAEHAGTGLSVSSSSPIPAGLRVAAAGFVALLMALVSLVLVIACANVAGVLMARATARRREIAVRLAMGAGRARLVRQLLTETTLLFLLGGAAGIAFARVLTSLLVSLLPAFPVPIDLSIPLDGRVVAFAITLSLTAALLSGLAPALHASRADVVSALKDDVQGPSDRLRLRSVFVVAQVAFSLVLVVIAGLLIAALQRNSAANRGFDSHGVDVVSLDLSLGGYTSATGVAFVGDLLDRVRRIGGVQAATVAAAAPGGGGLRFPVTIPGVVPPHGEPFFQAGGNIVAPGYFAITKIPLVAGRDFSDADRSGAAPVAIVGEAAARLFWSVARAEDAIGKFIVLRNADFAASGSASDASPALLVVGVVHDVDSSGAGAPSPSVYLPVGQRYVSRLVLMTRSADGQRSSASIRALLATMDPKLPILSVRALDQQDGPVAVQLRVASAVSGGVGFVGLLLAAIGVYGVTAYTVTRRTREFGIRVAMGARPADVVRMVLLQGLSLVGIGSAFGLALAIVASRMLKRAIFGIPPLDPISFAGAVVLFVAIGAIACWLPARRATRIDAMEALRCE